MEVSCDVRKIAIQPKPPSRLLTDDVLALLRRVVESETRFIDAIRSGSLEHAVEAMAIHPNVYSRACAERFLSHYFPLEQ